MKNRVLRAFIIGILILIMFVGVLLIAIPTLQAWHQDEKMHQVVEEWESRYAATTKHCEGDETVEPEPPIIYPDLLAAMKEYNEEIYYNGQSGLVDAWSYQKDVFDLSEYGIENEAVGVIRIPEIDVELPLYLGATYENMAQGFAQLTQTSMPIGGKGTNCVVACHRGYQGSAYMRDADQLSVGDTVYLENYWGTLCYEIVEFQVIDPNDTDAILIQHGRDLLTIITCTPYRVATHRLLVFCERVQTDTDN